MAKRLFSMAGLAVVVLIVLAACGAPEDEGPVPTVTRIPDAANAPVVSPTPEGGGEESAATPVSQATAEEPDASAGGEGEVITIVSHDIFFDPAELTVPAGMVTFDLPNEGSAPHNFSIDELQISVDLPPGVEELVDVELPVGSYEYYCNVPGHKDAGMVGTLTVE